MLFRIQSLQQRLFLLLLVPTSLILAAVGFVGFLFARNIMLDSWQEAAILKLQRAAHHIDMRLSLPIEWIQLFHQSGGVGGSFATPKWILDHLRSLEGVAKVELKWKDQKMIEIPERRMGRGMRGAGMMRFHRGRISEITNPKFDAQIGQETVNLVSQLKNEAGQVIGALTVSVRFDYLMQDILDLGWWQSDVGYLVDEAGRFLAHTKGLIETRKRLGETDNPIELTLLEEIHIKPFGTILGTGHPPREIAGFYQIRHASWTIVLMAPGKKILAPIIRFRNYYFLAGAFCIFIIILLIRTVAGRMAESVRKISFAAGKVAKGDYVRPMVPDAQDEIGQLVGNFNTMVDGLKQRDFISNTFGRYVDEEVARELMKRPEASRLGGEKREVVILMSDLRDFTPLSETLTPEQTIHLLNHYFSHMIAVIQQNRGIIVDFFGDALLVFFDPLDGLIQPCADRAITCAFDMQKEVANFNGENRNAGLPELHMGIGLHAGEVVVGNIGSKTRAKYGIVGAAVNLTHRIQSEAQPGEIVLTESACTHISRPVTIARSATVMLKGVREPALLHILEGN
jgi:class 3 adenylate cyclase